MLQTNAVTADLRRPFGERALVVSAAGFLGLMTLFMLGATVVAGLSSPPLGLVLLPTAAVMGFLTWYVWREAAANWSVRITLQGEAAHLVLPAARGLAVQGALDTWVPLAAITTIEAREEAFRSLGATTIQTAYALVLADGQRIVLGADRPMKDPFFGRAAAAIAGWAKVAIHNRGLYDGQAGPALIGGNAAPAWTAAPLDDATARRRRNGAAWTWRIVGLVIVAIAAVRALAALLH